MKYINNFNIHKKIIVAFMIIFSFFITSIQIDASSCKIEDIPTETEESYFESNNFNKKDYPYFYVSRNCALDHGRYDTLSYVFSAVPFKVNADGKIYSNGLVFFYQNFGSGWNSPVFISTSNNSGTDTFVTANHTVKNADGTDFFHVPPQPNASLKGEGEKLLQTILMIVGLMVSLAVLVVFLKKLARVFKESLSF